MSHILNKFPIFSKFDENTKENIHLFHVFRDENGDNILYVTKSDEVYTVGTNQHGCCGSGHNSVVNEPQIIPELCHKKIKQFFIGFNFLLSLCENGHVYGWGHNTHGQLGRNFNSEQSTYFKPHKISFTEEIIADISCGVQHALAITPGGNIYGWGDNQYGQVGLGKGSESFISKPTRIKKFEEIIIRIMCSFNRSFALTNEGMVYSWGTNYGCDLGQEINRSCDVFEPRLINISNVISICSSNVNTYFLRSDGNIHFCGHYRRDDNFLNQGRPKILKSSKKFSSLFSMSHFCKYRSISFANCDGLIYYLNSNYLEETGRSDFIEYLIDEFEVCAQTMNLSELSTENQNLIWSGQEPLKKKEFKKRFIEHSGYFAQLQKVNDRRTQDVFTVVKFSRGLNSLIHSIQ